MKTIKLVGDLGNRFGREFTLDVQTPAEAMRALILQMPEMRSYLMDSAEHGIAYRVITDDPNGLDEDGACLPFSKKVVFAPVPVGKGAVGKIIAGVVLVGLAIFLAPVGAAAATIFGTKFGALSLGVGAIGLSFVFGGVADLLTPTPKVPNITSGGFTSPGGGIAKSPSTAENASSFSFDKSNVNSIQGDVVPILYGERIISSLAVISFGLTIKNEA